MSSLPDTPYLRFDLLIRKRYGEGELLNLLLAMYGLSSVSLEFCLVVPFPLLQKVGGVVLILGIHHWMMEPAQKDQIVGTVPFFVGETRLSSRTIIGSGIYMADLAQYSVMRLLSPRDYNGICALGMSALITTATEQDFDGLE
ncbi:hypothetical protein KDW63_31420 [Burkholderia cenocepacia]|uniref:hypothetical protein n=1 Tax=Burkholderia cenocepacia TaxID=95486 RepID=UPI0015892838|nr:hypothetical protein [Burkholderia cenocepacia]MBR7990111.1 hypothetical protein [Burkholderia cenocepacia]MBR8298719.1 hypothetical protein [Burkholderia cenocepacia]